jgi:hypothetical protein
VDYLDFAFHIVLYHNSWLVGEIPTTECSYVYFFCMRGPTTVFFYKLMTYVQSKVHVVVDAFIQIVHSTITCILYKYMW